MPDDLEQIVQGMEFVPGNIQVCNAAGQIQYVNPQCAAALNCRAEEIIGHDITSFWDQPEELSRDILTHLRQKTFWQGKIKQKIPQANTARQSWDGWELVALSMPENKTGEQPFIIKTGQPLHTEETSQGTAPEKEIQATPDSSTELFELKKTKLALEESERIYRTILETSPHSVGISQLSDSVYVLVNEAFARNTGYSREVIIGKKVQDLNLFHTAEERNRFLETFLATGRVDSMEMTFRKKDGTLTYSLVSARPIQYGNTPCIMVMTTNIDVLKQTQQSLREREANYRTILEVAPYSVVITKISDTTYVEANPACCNRIGYSRDEVIGKTPFELNLYDDPKDRERLIETLKQEGYVVGMEIAFQSRDGKRLESLMSAAPIQYNGEACLLFLSVDITHQKQVQRELAEREASYRAILETSPFSIAITSVSRGVYVEVNNSFTKRTGFSREQIIGRSPLDLNFYENPEDEKRLIDTLGENGKISGMEMNFRIKDGSIKEILLSTNPIQYRGELCLLTVMVDISRQKKAERALRRSEQKYRNILLHMEEGYWETDLKGNFTFVNDAECRFHRCSAKNLIGTNNRDYTSPETARRVYTTFNTIFRTGKPAMIHEYEFVRSDGSTAFVDSSASLLKDENGEPTGFYGIARDITEKKRADDELAQYRKHLEKMVEERTEELETAQSELVKREKLSVLGQLTATVSHELRNPLGVIRSSNFFLQRKIHSDNEKIEKHFKRIDEQVNHCDLIVADLLEFTRGRSLSIETRNMVPWIKELMAQLEESEGIHIETRFDETLPAIPHDQEKIRRVLVNLIENASQAVHAKAEKMEKENTPYIPHIRLMLGLDGDMVRIEICDNGSGMDEETCARAFEPLFTTRARGTGIGLANVHKIITEHSGQIELSSSEEEGTTAIVRLPLIHKK